MEKRKQQTQSQVKLLEKILRVIGEVRQTKHKVTSGPAMQPFDELVGQYYENSREADDFHHSHVQVDNLMSVTGGHLNTVITVTPQNVFSHTNPTT